jgi:uncharacterized protein (TIGR00369 family)
LGLVCLDKSEPGTTTWQAVADERFANPAGVIQGGFLAAIVDSAMGAAAVTYALAKPGRRVSSANVEMKTSYLAPARVGTLLTCRATVISGGERVVFCEAELSDDEGRLVVKASSTYVITPRDRPESRSPEQL